MADEIKYDANGDARVFAGRGAVDVFAMAAIATALRLYARTGLKANRAYTPTNMMRAAAHHTGQTFKARDYEGAAAALEAKLQAEKARIAALCANCHSAPATWRTTLKGGMVLCDRCRGNCPDDTLTRLEVQ